jgi:hypothetical protein
VLAEDFANGVEILVQEIFFLVVAHPHGQQRAAPAHDSGDAVAHQGQEFAQHAGVDGHVVHALLGLLFDHLEHQADAQIFRSLHARQRFVNWHGAHGYGRSLDDRPADLRDVAAGRKVHHCVAAELHRVSEFLQLLVHIRCDRGIADIRVDFAFKRDADAHRLEVLVVDIRGDDGAAALHLAAHELGRQAFTPRDIVHLTGNHALAGVVHLADVSAPVRGRRRRQSLFNPAIPKCHEFPREQ